MIKLNQNQYIELNKKYDEHYKKYDYQSYELAKDVYLFGAASRQAEIELLEKEIIETQEFLNNQNCIKQAEIDELQKRIDDALNVFKSDLSEIGKFDTIHKILKGQNNG